MNIELTENAKHKEIAARLAKAEKAKAKAEKAGCRHLETTMRSWLTRLNLSRDFHLEVVNIEVGMIISTKADRYGRFGYIDINYLPGVIEPADGARSRSLEIAVRALRITEERSQDGTIARASGLLAKATAEIKRDFSDYDWSVYDKARRDVIAIRNELCRFEAEYYKARLAKGVRIKFSGYQIAEIDRLTPKRLYFKDGAYEDIDESVEKLVDGRWKIV